MNLRNSNPQLFTVSVKAGRLLSGRFQNSSMFHICCQLTAFRGKRGQLSTSTIRLAKIIAPAESIAAGLGKNYPRLADRVKLIKMGTFVPESAACFSRPGRLATVAAACSVKEKTDFGKFFSAIKRLAVEGCEFMTIIIGNGSAEKPLRSIDIRIGHIKNRLHYSENRTVAGSAVGVRHLHRTASEQLFQSDITGGLERRDSRRRIQRAASMT